MKGLARQLLALVVIGCACVVAYYLNHSTEELSFLIRMGCKLVAVSLLCAIAGGLCGFNFEHQGRYPYLFLICYLLVLGICVATTLSARYMPLPWLLKIFEGLLQGQLAVYLLGFYATFYLASSKEK